jgi:hypothetical protein
MEVFIQTFSSMRLAYDSNQSPSLSFGVKSGQLEGKGMNAMWVYCTGSCVTNVWRDISSIYSMLLKETHSVSVAPVISHSIIPVNEKT